MLNTTIATQIYAKISFETTQSQKKIIEQLSEYISGDDFSRFFILNGYAGTGKTTVVAALVAALKSLGIKSIYYCFGVKPCACKAISLPSGVTR